MPPAAGQLRWADRVSGPGLDKSDVGVKGEQSPRSRRHSHVSFRSSGGGSSQWSTALAITMQEVAKWLSPSDLRRARLVCRNWRAVLAPLSTSASTPLEPGTVGKWKAQLSTMVRGMPCLRELTIRSRLSDVAAQQLVILAAATQLRSLKIPHGQDLRDKSLQSLQHLGQLQQLTIWSASSLTSKCLLTLSVLHQLTHLDLKHCGRISWLELQQAWQAACATAARNGTLYPAAAAAAAAAEAGEPPVAGLGEGSGLLLLRRPGSGSFAHHLMVHGRQRVSSGGGSTPLSPKTLIRKRALAAAHAAKSAGPGGELAGAGLEEHGLTAAAAAGVGVWQGYGPTWDLQQQQQQQLIGAHPGNRQRSGLRITSGGSSALMGSSSSSSSSSSSKGPSDGGAAGRQQQQQQQVAGGFEAPAGVAAVLGAAAATAAVVQSASRPNSGGGAAGAAGGTAAAAPLFSSRGLAGPVASEGLGRQVSAVQLALMAYLATPEGREALRASGGSQGGTGRLSGRGGSTGLPAMPFPMLQSLAFTCTDLTGSRPVAELAAIASLPRLTSLEITRCHQLSDAAVWKLTALKRLARLKLANVWSLTDFGLEGLASLTGLTSLTLIQPNQASARGLLALTSLTRLQSLTVAVTQELGPSALPWLVCELPSLRSVDITSSSWTNSACEVLAAGAAGAAGQQLSSLKLRSCEQLTQGGLLHLAKLPGLQLLQLEGCKGVSCGQVLGQGQLPKGLASLALKGCSWGNLFTECLEVPACLSSLTSLNLTGELDVNEQQLRKALGFFPGLRELSLSGSLGVSDAALSGIGRMRKLRQLDLSGTRVQGLFLEGLLAPAGAGAGAAGAGAGQQQQQQQLGELRELSLRGCSRLGDAGLRLVAQQLLALEVLDIAEAGGVSNRGVVAVMEGAGSLVKLDVSSCKGLTREVVQLCPHYLRLLHTIK